MRSTPLNKDSTSCFCAAMLAEPPLVLSFFGGNNGEGEDLLLDEISAQLNMDVRTSAERPMTRFFTASNREVIGSTLLHIIRQIRATESMKDGWSRKETVPTRGELREWYELRMMLQYQLLAMPFASVPSTSVQRAVRLALRLCCDLEMSPAGPPPPFCRSMAARVRSHLEQADLESLCSASSDLLF